MKKIVVLSVMILAACGGMEPTGYYSVEATSTCDDFTGWMTVQQNDADISIEIGIPNVIESPVLSGSYNHGAIDVFGEELVEDETETAIAKTATFEGEYKSGEITGTLTYYNNDDINESCVATIVAIQE